MKKALVVGIDDYVGIALSGCVADAEEFAKLVERHADGQPNYQVRRVTAPPSTVNRDQLRALLADLFANAGENELLFYFSGHGAETPFGAELVTQDYSENSPGVSINDVLTLANDSAAKDIVVVLDCCFSGSLGNVPSLQAATTAPEFRFAKALLRQGVTLLAASRPEEPSVEEGGHGAFTRLLLEGLEGAAADPMGIVTPLSLYAFASRAFGAWDQRPLLKAHSTLPSVLRTCEPAISRAVLRQLPTHFSSRNARVQMSPAHEGSRPVPAGQQPTIQQRQFDYFKQLRNAGLLTTGESKDLYFVAMESGDVFLTVLGKYFWDLASKGLL
jgi:hypothetical protein